MGRLVDGKWQVEDVITSDSSGSYKRQDSVFRDAIKAGSKFEAESGRYHLYVSFACPWASRTLMYRKLKELEDHIGYSVVHPDMLDDGWTFDKSFPGATGDDLYDLKYLREIYLKADPKATTKITVPVLWDKKTETIVNNESSEIIRMFNTEFNGLTGNREDFYPEKQREEIDEWNELIYHTVNNGVYKSGFAKNQEAYEAAVKPLFETLDKLEGELSDKPFLHGEKPLESDLRLFPTLIRFDEVYVTHFKCNLKRIADYPNLQKYTERIYNIPGMKETVNLDHIKRHYFYSHESINPHRILPVGPMRWTK